MIGQITDSSTRFPAYLEHSLRTRSRPLSRLARWVVPTWLLFVAVAQSASAQNSNHGDIPKEVHDLVGTFAGSWTSFGIDPQGNIVQRNAWKDILKAEKPGREGQRAFVITVDEMVFERGPGQPMKVTGREGYVLRADGTTGEYFIEMHGQVQKLQNLAENVWASTTSASEGELLQLGFPAGASAQHVLVKVVSREHDTETHRITRVTSVHWTDQSGKERWLQCVSLEGAHRRQP